MTNVPNIMLRKKVKENLTKAKIEYANNKLDKSCWFRRKYVHMSQMLRTVIRDLLAR